MTKHADSAKTGVSRRTLLGGGAATTLGIALSGSLGPLARASGVDHGRSNGENGAAGGFDGYGPLQADPDGRLACLTASTTRSWPKPG